MNKPDVFISYRREGGLDDARLVQLALKNRGYETFLDYSSIRKGKFNEAIDEAIRVADNFVLIVTDGAFDRCTESDDWVRREIELALKLKKNIIPVVPEGHLFTFPAVLPPTMQALREIQLKKLAKDSLFDESVDKFVAECFVGGRSDESQETQHVRPAAKRHSCLVGLLVLVALGFSFVLLCVLLGEDEGEDSKVATQAPCETKTSMRSVEPVEQTAIPGDACKALGAQTRALQKGCVGAKALNAGDVPKAVPKACSGAKAIPTLSEGELRELKNEFWGLVLGGRADRDVLLGGLSADSARNDIERQIVKEFLAVMKEPLELKRAGMSFEEIWNCRPDFAMSLRNMRLRVLGELKKMVDSGDYAAALKYYNEAKDAFVKCGMQPPERPNFSPVDGSARSASKIRFR